MSKRKKEALNGSSVYKRLARNLIIERKKRKLTQEDLAYLAYIHPTYLVRIECGRANPTVKVIHKISKAMHLKLQALFR